MADRDEAAKRNREKLPIMGSVLDEYRAVFGSGVKLVCAVEDGNRIGREQDIQDMQKWAQQARQAAE